MRVCPSCGSTYADERDACPLCGVRLIEQDKTQVLTVHYPTAPVLYQPCPHCGQKVLTGLDPCPWCRRPMPDPSQARPPAETTQETPPPTPTPTREEAPTVYVDPRLMAFETMDTEETRIIERPRLSPFETPEPPAPAPPPQPRPPQRQTPVETPAPVLSAASPPVRIGIALTAVGLLSALGLSGYWLIRRHTNPVPKSPTVRSPAAPLPKSAPPTPPPGPTLGRLVLNFPTPAEVYIDGHPTPATPGNEISVPAGSRRVRVVWPADEKSGMPPAARELTVEVLPGQAVTLSVTPPTPARLYVNTWPWSEVWIDGRRLGETPGVWTVPAGPHDLEFRRPDGRAYRLPVELPEGGILRVGYDFATGRLWQNPPP